MWIFGNGIGFLSIVEDDHDTDQLCVRARNVEHLKAAFPTFEENIIETPEGDYRWRISIDRSVVMDLMVELIQDIVYKTNVKGTVAGDDKKLSSAMMSCWSAMCRYQDSLLDPIGETSELEIEDTALDDEWEDDYEEPEDDGPIVATVPVTKASELAATMRDAVASISEEE
jgi:hypothetical protein